MGQSEADAILVLKRRDYRAEKREKNKFDRNHVLPPYKFYIQSQKIREIQFEINMELKRLEQDQSRPLLQYLEQLLEEAKRMGRFDDWSEQ